MKRPSLANPEAPPMVVHQIQAVPAPQVQDPTQTPRDLVRILIPTAIPILILIPMPGEMRSLQGKRRCCVGLSRRRVKKSKNSGKRRRGPKKKLKRNEKKKRLLPKVRKRRSAKRRARKRLR